MVTDAVVVAGGRSSRLGGCPKQALRVDGVTLLARTLRAAADCRRRVVVGDPMPAVASGALDLVWVREHPPYSGPAAALAAGLDALARVDGSPLPEAVLVLACDMPGIAGAVPVLRAAFEAAPASEGVVARDERGRDQPLAAVYRYASLGSAARRDTVGLSMRALVGGLRLRSVVVPAGSTHDIDTWQDARRWRVEAPSCAGDDRENAAIVGRERARRGVSTGRHE